MATKVKPREGADGKAFVQPSRNYTAPSSAGTKDNSGGSRTSKPPRKPIGDRSRRRRNAQQLKRQGFLDPKPSSGGDDHGGKLTHRERSDEDGPFMDERYIRSHYKVPTIQDYPTAPSTVFGAKFDFGVLHGAVKSMLKLRTGCELIGNTTHRFVIRYTPPGGEEQSVIGEDAGRVKSTVFSLLTYWLTVSYRGKQQERHMFICWPGCMSRVFSVTSSSPPSSSSTIRL